MSGGHAVVDGSNIATEGRSEPSLAQLEEAVAAFTADHDFSHVTVVVDASFEHRVAKRERAAVERAIDEGRIIMPPAGVVGRGDTFILEIAERADAVVLSNDSFQEFHGEYEWLFEEGRLIGGKPVPHVGWVFVPRRPVRGATSREAVRKARSAAAAAAKTPTKRASVKKTPAEKATTKKTSAKKTPAKKTPAEKATTKKTSAKKTSPGSAAEERDGERDPRQQEPHNPIRAWRRFRGQHPLGSSVEAKVDRFSSHGAHAVLDGGLAAYIPSKLLADPPPKRARDVIDEGSSARFVVHEYEEDTRGIVLGLLPFVAAQRNAGSRRSSSRR
jgi:hypothetical protein